MTISSLNIKINVHETKDNEEWVAQKKTNFWGDKTTIKFYQREKSQSNFQKLADFFTGVKPGREVATKYINELGLTRSLLNPKNESAAPPSNDEKDTELNAFFQSAAIKSKTSPTFEGDDPLVSHRNYNTKKEITIKINGNQIQNATSHRMSLQNAEFEYFLINITGPQSQKFKNALPQSAINTAIDILENSPTPISPTKVTDAHRELTKFKTESNGQPWLNAEVSNRLDRLISALGSKLEILKQTAQTGKSVKNEASIKIKNEMKVFFNDFTKLDISPAEKQFTYLALVRAFDFRDNYHNQPLSSETKEAHKTLTNFRDNSKTQAGFGAISEKFDQLITVLESKLSSIEKTAQT